MRDGAMIRRVKTGAPLRYLTALWRRLEEGPVESRLDAGTSDNARLTALCGLVLVVLLAFVYATGVLFGSLRGVHFFVGFALVPTVVLKLGSTGWRFAQYYLGTAPYRAAGPPSVFPRLLAPLLMATTGLAVASGVVLWAVGNQQGVWSTVHTDSVIVLLLFLGLHLALHLRRAVWAVCGDGAARAFRWRWAAAGLAVALGLGLAGGMAVGEPPWHDRQAEFRGHAGMPIQMPAPGSVSLNKTVAAPHESVAVPSTAARRGLG